MSTELVIANNLQPDTIKDVIYEIRGQKVMLDYDLAAIYGVKTATLNQAVKRNIDRFSGDFMFRVTEEEWEQLLNSDMISQFVTSSLNKSRPLTTSLTSYETRNQNHANQ